MTIRLSDPTVQIGTVSQLKQPPSFRGEQRVEKSNVFQALAPLKRRKSQPYARKSLFTGRRPCATAPGEAHTKRAQDIG